VSLLLLAVFVLIELRSRLPLVPFSIFRLRTLRGANAVALLVAMSLFSMFFFISLYLQQVLGYDALKTGFAYLPLALTIIVSAGIASALVTRIGFKIVLTVGMLFVAAGLAWFSRGWSIPRSRNPFSELLVYTFAAAGLLYLAQLWTKGTF